MGKYEQRLRENLATYRIPRAAVAAGMSMVALTGCANAEREPAPVTIESEEGSATIASPNPTLGAAPEINPTRGATAEVESQAELPDIYENKPENMSRGVWCGVVALRKAAHELMDENTQGTFISPEQYYISVDRHPIQNGAKHVFQVEYVHEASDDVYSVRGQMAISSGEETPFAALEDIRDAGDVDIHTFHVWKNGKEGGSVFEEERICAVVEDFATLEK